MSAPSDAARTRACRPRLFTYAAALAGVLAALPAAAAPRVLTLDAAVRAALERGPAVATAQLDVTAADALATEASRRPPLRVELDAENWGGSEGNRLLETTAGLGWTVELGGDRGARRAGAAASSEAARASQELARRDARAAVSADFVTAWVAQERRALLREARADAASAIDAARERLRAGAAPAVEVARAESEAARAGARVVLAEAEFAGAVRALAGHWAADSAAFNSLSLGAPDEAAAPAAAAAAHPDVARAAAGEHEAEAAVRAAGARHTPDLDVLLGVRRFRELGVTGYVASLSVPLGATGGGELAAARARREQAALERASAERRLRSGAADAAARLAAALAAWRELSGTAAPRADEALALLRAGYRAGRFGYADLAEGRRAALEAREGVIDAAAAVWRARVELERYSGATPANGDGEVTR